MKLMKLSLSVGAVAALSITSTFAADKVDVSKLPAAATKQGVTYEKDIKAIFEQACIKCHGPEKQKGKYRVDSLAAVVKGGESGDKSVIPGKSAESPLVHYIGYLVEDMEMPPKDKEGKSRQLSKENIALVRAWIDQGAK